MPQLVPIGAILSRRHHGPTAVGPDWVFDRLCTWEQLDCEMIQHCPGEGHGFRVLVRTDVGGLSVQGSDVL